MQIKLLITILLATLLINTDAASIKGKLMLDNSWSPVVYISEINSFHNLHTASYDLLRFKIVLDSAGYFEINNLELPEQDLIYRLYVCKKGDPESSIIIGGKDENFIHFIMNAHSDVEIIQDPDNWGIPHCLITGAQSGDALKQLFDLQNRLDLPPDLPSENNRNFTKKQVLEGFEDIVDTTSNPIVRLLAMHFINESFATKNNLPLMNKLNEDLANVHHNSLYFSQFSDHLEFLNFQARSSKASLPRWLFYMLLILIVSVLAYLFWKRKLIVNDREPKIKLLSTQERRVFNLLKKGKTNKEISAELNIEVSTVKSHLHNIYTRLGIRSRREIVDLEL